MDIGTYVLYDKVIDLTFYKYERKIDATKGTWEVDDSIVQSSEYRSPDGTVYKKAVDIYTKDVVIKCSDYGVKPDISLSFKAVPGRNVTQCELRITNLQLDSLRVKEWALVEIVAGYSGEGAAYGKTKLSMDIFSAWTETPNPDGVTVIQGIATGGALGMFFGPRKFYIQFNVEELTIRELVTRLLNQEDVLSFPTFHEDIEVPFLDKKIGTIIDPTTGLAKKEERTFGDLKIQVQNIRLSADSGYQIIQWVGRELYSWGKEHGWLILTDIFNDRVKINCIYGNDENEGEDTVVLSAIDSAAFTGSVLTVKGPWTPSLIPGGLFKLDAQYFSLQNTYRRTDPSIYIDKNNLYRCITMEVSFDTCGNNNQMIMMAVPYGVAEDPWESYGESSVEFLTDNDKKHTLNMDQWIQQKQNRDTLMTTIVFGKSDVEKHGKATQGSFWSKLEGITISNVNSKVVRMNEDVNEESLTSVNWFRIFIATALANGHGALSDDSKVHKAFPVLSRSEMHKILRAIDKDKVAITPSMYAKLYNSKSLKLNPDTLWILYPIYAYIQSLQHDGALAAIMDKNTLGAMLTSSFNTNVEGDFEVDTIIQGSEEDSNVVYIPDIKAATFSSSPEGNRSDWDQFKGFQDVMNLVIKDKTLYAKNRDSFDWNMFVVWYYYFTEVAK